MWVLSFPINWQIMVKWIRFILYNFNRNAYVFSRNHRVSKMPLNSPNQTKIFFLPLMTWWTDELALKLINNLFPIRGGEVGDDYCMHLHCRKVNYEGARNKIYPFSRWPPKCESYVFLHIVCSPYSAPFFCICLWGLCSNKLLPGGRVSRSRISIILVKITLSTQFFFYNYKVFCQKSTKY